MPLTQTQIHYWQKNLRFTIILLAVWFLVTFVMGFFAAELAKINFFGWPLSFYMAAQGSLIVYVVLIWIYQDRMHKLDVEHGVEEGED